MAEATKVVYEEVLKTQADAETAERVIEEKRIGERIRHLRLKKSMGLVELGRHTGLSPSFLSQLETGRVVPTLRNLARIGMVFSKDLSYFFDSEPAPVFRIHRRSERIRMPQVGAEPPDYFFESLGYLVPDRDMDPYYAEFIPPEGGAEPVAHIHEGYEFLYVLEGELALTHSGQEHVLEAGDAVYFDAGTPHSYRCRGAKTTGAIIVTLPETSASQPRPLRAANKQPAKN